MSEDLHRLPLESSLQRVLRDSATGDYILPGLPLTGKRWQAAVETRWAEICEHLDYQAAGKTHYPHSTVLRMIGELNALYVVTQYAGSNARTGWFIVLESYRRLFA